MKMQSKKLVLEVNHLKAGYGEIPVVHDVSFKVYEGNVVAILGSNGSGKTSSLRAVAGMIKTVSGNVKYYGEDCTGMPSYKLAKKGISMVPEGRHLFGGMTVKDNLLMGAYLIHDKKKIQDKLEEVYSLFPRVEERSKQLANTLSGGEQQMVAIARGLMAHPKLLILDEPTLGLMPMLVKEIFELIKKIAKTGITVIIVEQNATDTLALSDYAYVIKNGETVIEGTGSELLNDENVQKAYLGG